MDLGIILAGIGFIGSVVVWGLRLEGRVNVQAQRVDDLKELINEKFNAANERLERIEHKIDSANGYGKH